MQPVSTSPPSTSPPTLRSASTSSEPSASSVAEDDKLMQDLSPSLNHQTHTSPALASTTVDKRTTTHTNTKDPDTELAESVMNWDLGTDNTRGTKRKTGGVQEPEKEVRELVVKLQKLSHDVHKVDGVRIIHVKFAPGVILKAKKLYQGTISLCIINKCIISQCPNIITEPWGTMVSALEDYQAMDIKVGQKFW